MIVKNLSNLLIYYYFFSFANSQCIPQTYTFNTRLNNVGINVDYNNDNVVVKDNNLLLFLDKESGGTRISLTNKLHYGYIEANLKVSPGSNIVSSFILMADNGDEIDFEFVGKDKTVIQTNFFYKGIPIYDKNAKFYNTYKDLTTTFNRYKIVWTPYYYQWVYNDIVLRTLHKNDTSTFPNSPSYVQFGIWLAQNSNWAGYGPDWSLQPFSVSINSISVWCLQLNTISKTTTVPFTSAITKTTSHTKKITSTKTKDVAITKTKSILVTTKPVSSARYKTIIIYKTIDNIPEPTNEATIEVTSTMKATGTTNEATVEATETCNSADSIYNWGFSLNSILIFTFYYILY